MDVGDEVPPTVKIGTVSDKPVETTSRKRKPAGWWDRFVQRRRRPHAPGVWIVYFSLAALPLFGIGQMFLPAGSLSARQYAFGLLCIYTASGLGLLLATSFLGLRRYLRQRRQEMPAAMVNLWLVIGGVLIGGVMLAALLLPRPNAEYAVSELPFRFGSPDQKSSPYGQGPEGVNEKRPEARGEQREGEQREGEKPDAATSNQSDKPSSGQPGEKRSSGDSAQAKGQGDDSHSPASRNPSPGKQQKGGEGQKSPGTEKGQSAQDKPSAVNRPEGKQGSGAQAAGKSTTGKSPSENTSSPRPGDNRRPDYVPRMPHAPLPNLPPVTPFVFACKLLLYGALVLLAIFAAWSNRDRLLAALANLGNWLADFWHLLFGGTAHGGTADENQAGPGKARLPRFADFRDPFAAGIAGRYQPEELVRYTFEALEAWARDHGHPREPEQTPHEFARRLAAQVSPLGDDAGRLAELYCQAAYAPGTLAAAPVARLSHLWQQLQAAAEAEVSGRSM